MLKEIPMKYKNIKIYTKSYCPYCIRLKKDLSKSGIDFEEIDVESRSDLYKKLKEQTGHQTVPQVFIDGKFIGGSEEYYKYKKENE